MLPYLNLGDIYLPFFSIGFSITCVIFLVLSFRSLREISIPENDALNIPAMICIGAIALSKIPLGFIYGWELTEYLKFWKTGHTLVGGIIISILLVFIYAKIRKISFLDVMVGLTYPAFFALSSYRIFVCFMSGCCYGFETEKYGLKFHPRSFAGERYLFPSQIVESFMFFVSGMITYKIRKWEDKGKIADISLLLLISERFVAELIRGDIKEKIIKVENIGLSIWFFALLILFVVIDTTLNIIPKWLEELKKERN